MQGARPSRWVPSTLSVTRGTERRTSRLPLVAFVLWRGIFRWYRVLTVAAVGSLVFAWGFAQSPYLLPGRLTIAQATAPGSTQVALLAVTLALVLVVVPSMGLLYYLDQRSALESTEH